MADIDRYRPDDRRAIEALYRRVFGPDMASANRLRWDWQYRLNPNVPAAGPLIWVAREGGAIVGQYACMPVRLGVNGHEIDAAWGMDVMVAPERQRQGLGDVLFRTWDRNVGASLGLGLSESSYRLFQKLKWPDVGPVPCLRQAAEPPRAAPADLAGADSIGSCRTSRCPWVKLVSRIAAARGRSAHDPPLRRSLHAAVGAREGQVRVRRPARCGLPAAGSTSSPPHVRYSIGVLERGAEVAGYVVYRHVQEPRGRVTLLVDFFADPDDASAVVTLLRWIDREARAADSDKIRTFSMHEGFRKHLRKSGYYSVKSTMEFVAKINARRRAGRRSTRTRAGGTSRSATPIRIDDAPRAARPCSSPSTPKATTSGTPARGGTRRSRTSTRSAGCTSSSRVTACGRPT